MGLCQPDQMTVVILTLPENNGRLMLSRIGEQYYVRNLFTSLFASFDIFTTKEYGKTKKPVNTGFTSFFFIKKSTLSGRQNEPMVSNYFIITLLQQKEISVHLFVRVYIKSLFVCSKILNYFKKM